MVSRAPLGIVLALLATATACGSAASTSTPAPATPTPRPPGQIIGCPAAAGPGGPTLTGVSFGDDQHGLVSGSDGFLWQTGDDGASWSVVVPPSGLRNLNGVRMTDPTHVWVWGDLGLYSVVAGGSAWVSHTTQLTAPVVAVSFVSGAPVVAMDATGAVATSSDGGSHWHLTLAGTGPTQTPVAPAGSAAPTAAATATPMPSAVPSAAASSGSAVQLRALAAPDSHHVFAVGDAGLIYASSDGGNNWTQQTSGSTAGLRAVWFTDPQNGIAVGSGSTVLSTSNGGTAWAAVSIAPTQADLTTVYFIDAMHGWIGGTAGAVLTSSDGGATWSPSVVTDGVTLQAFLFQTISHGWTVADKTAIEETSDKGATWKRRNFCGTS